MRVPLDKANIVIIGNGIAGLTAAVEARRLAPDKSIVIITDQTHPTINTPSLKQFAIAKLSREQLLAYPAGTEKRERIHLISSHVEYIHAQSKYISLKGNGGFGYDSLLIATGSSPSGLPDTTPGRNFDGVMTLHRLQDYLDLRRRIPEVHEAVVVGGGVHAIETVMGLLYWGIRVHWLIRGSIFMNRILDEVSSNVVLNNIQKAGAVVHLSTEIAGVIGRVGAVAGVITNHQEMIPCQLVLSCTGTKPAQVLAKNCSVPMQQKNGILVDSKLRTSVRDIYAAGDVAALLNPLTGKYEPRALWYAAVLQGKAVGAIMAGEVESANRSFGVQWHATHLGELSMLTVGEPLSEDESVTTLTDNSQGNYRRITIANDRLVGYLSLGTTPPDSLAIKRIIDEEFPVHDILKPLLKGKFDARAYLSQKRSRTTRTLMNQQSPAPIAQQVRPVMVQQQQPQPQQIIVQTNNPYTYNTRMAPPPMQPQQPAQPYAPAARVRQQYYEEEINPFTGNLPVPDSQQAQPFIPAARNRNTDPLEDIDTLAWQTGASRIVDEINPFTGNLPAYTAERRRLEEVR
ncbi:MAG TPA: FAD-dependent oxidoreductase [Dictyobacter sp.]|nr:FAD-dependent oxidoreductase [Dictyobacter sp.]